VVILVRHQVAVKIIVDIFFGNLVAHDEHIGDAFNNGGRYFVKVLKVLLFIVAGVPAALCAVLTSLDNEDDILIGGRLIFLHA
jgi:hypothetical protein